MEQHPIPRQITTFEFKLIGFMTLKQFLYLVVFIPIAYIAYRLFPIPILNIIIGLIVLFIGLAFAFFPVNDRPFDVLIRNLFKRLFSPTQFIYHKDSKPLYFLGDLFFLKDPHLIASHIESKEKLNAYLTKTKSDKQQASKKIVINNPVVKPTVIAQAMPPIPVKTASVNPAAANSQPLNLSLPNKPFLLGVIKNNKKLPLAGVLIYVKDQKGETLRLLKTNPHGVFATFKALPKGEYSFEIKDPEGKHFFDTMKIKVEENNPQPFEFYSKEIL